MKLTKYLLVSALLVGAAATDADAQVKNLSGKVTEIFNGKTEVMVGVNINIVNSQNRSLVGAITDLNGNFNISVPDEKNLTIEISYIGKKTVRIKYTGQSRLDVKLDDATQEVSEVVITANRLDRNSMGISSHEQVSASWWLLRRSLRWKMRCRASWAVWTSSSAAATPVHVPASRSVVPAR